MHNMSFHILLKKTLENYDLSDATQSSSSADSSVQSVVLLLSVILERAFMQKQAVWAINVPQQSSGFPI